MSSAAHHQLSQLEQHLQALREARITPAQFSSQARQAGDVLAGLPERFGAVLQQLLNGLEAGASFHEASCSFDQSQLHQNLQDWLAAARQRLGSSSSSAPS